jgi:hypothetical protein
MARPVTGRKDSRGFHTAIGGSSTLSGCGGIHGAGLDPGVARTGERHALTTFCEPSGFGSA